MMRISVDFNTIMMDPRERVLIPTHVEPDLARRLRSGQDVLIHDETLEVEAIAEFDSVDRRWWAQPNWTTRRHLPEAVSSGRLED